MCAQCTPILYVIGTINIAVVGGTSEVESAIYDVSIYRYGSRVIIISETGSFSLFIYNLIIIKIYLLYTLFTADLDLYDFETGLFFCLSGSFGTDQVD